MARRKPDPTGKLIAVALAWFLRQSRRVQPAVVGVALAVGLSFLVVWAFRASRPLGPPVPPGTVVFMFWNVENLFDDHDDRRNSIDDPYDNWFATDPTARNLKYAHLAEIILRVN